MTLSHNEGIAVAAFGLFSAMNSFLGIGVVVCLFFVFLQFRKTGARLVFYLSVSDFLWIGSVFIGLVWSLFTDVIPSVPCQILGFVTQWFIVSTDCWVAYIAVFLYLKVVHNRSSHVNELIAHIFCWGMPFFLAWLPIVGVGDGYGMAGRWCWVVDPDWRLFFSYFFAWTAFLIIAVSNVLVCLNIWQSGRRIRAGRGHISLTQQDRRRHKENVRYFRKLTTFPIVFCLQWIPATVNRAQNAIWPDHPIVYLYCIHIFVTLAGGILNSLLYGVAVRRSLYRLLSSLLCCKKRSSKKRKREQMRANFRPDAVDGNVPPTYSAFGTLRRRLSGSFSENRVGDPFESDSESDDLEDLGDNKGQELVLTRVGYGGGQAWAFIPKTTHPDAVDHDSSDDRSSDGDDFQIVGEEPAEEEEEEDIFWYLHSE